MNLDFNRASFDEFPLLSEVRTSLRFGTDDRIPLTDRPTELAKKSHTSSLYANLGDK